jgi:hypothetical protein
MTVSPLIQFVALWVAISAGLISIGHNADQWMDEDARRRFSESIRTKLTPDWAHWVRTVHHSFITFFDAIYRRRRPELDRALWQSVLFCYAILALARVVLKVFRIPVPHTPSILLVAVVIAVGGTLFVQAFRAGGQLLVRHYLQPLTKWEMVRSREFRLVVLYGSSALFIYTAAAILTGHSMGVTARTVIAISFGASIGVPTMLAITLIPDRVLPVSPLSALVSSILALGLLAVFFRSPARAFINDLSRSHWSTGCLILFNLFADMVSLIETRWVLIQSGRRAMLRGILGMLLVDLILSALIFFILPGIADQNLNTLLEGIIFKGPLPWTGILFWSTFATSLIFYVFVGAVLVLKLLMPVFATARSFDEWFPIYNHPVRLVAMVMVALITVGLVIGIVINWVL